MDHTRTAQDRPYCLPLAIARFIDTQAEFLHVPTSEVLRLAETTGAIPYDIPGVELSHVGDRCSFDAFLGNTNWMTRHFGSLR